MSNLAPVNNVNNSISKYFTNDKVNAFLQEQLGEKKGEFVSNILALSDADPNLSKCEPSELMKCAMNATALNLPLNKNLGYAYVIAYNGKPQFQMGYKGFIQLAIRSGQYKTINSCEVREGEINRNKFTGEIEFLQENPNGKVIGYLGYIKLINGFEQSLFMSVEQVQEHAKRYSKTYAKYGKGLWADDFDKMANKTVLKLLLSKYGILSTELQKAVEIDQADDKGNYPDNPNSVVEIEAEQVSKPTQEQIELDRLKETLETIQTEDELRDLWKSTDDWTEEQRTLIEDKRKSIKSKSKK